MFITVVGAKGGIGTTNLATGLAKASRGLGLDLTRDRQLAARLERPAWPLARPIFAGEAQRRGMLEQVLDRRVTLLWTPECVLRPDDARGFVSALAQRAPVVADAGLEPLAGIDGLADLVLIVTDQATSVARWHTQRLQQRYGGAVVTGGGRESIRSLAAQLFNS